MCLSLMLLWSTSIYRFYLQGMSVMSVIKILFLPSIYNISIYIINAKICEDACLLLFHALPADLHEI